MPMPSITKLRNRVLGNGVALTHDRPARWWIWPLALYTLARIINVVMINIASESAITPQQGGLEERGYFVTQEGPAPPGYLTTVTNWDGQWYWQIAAHGYPDHLPRSATRQVVQNEFGFMPLFPMLARALMTVTGLDFPIVATSMSIFLGAICTLLLYLLVDRRSDALGANIAVVCLSAFTCAPVFLIAYADALALLLVLLVLHLVIRNKLIAVPILLTALAFTRYVVAAFALLFVVLLFSRWRSGAERKHLAYLLALSIWSALVTLAWPVVVAVMTGERNAYFLSIQTWGTDTGQLAVIRFLQSYSGALGGLGVAILVAAVWIAIVVRLVTMGQSETTLKAWSGLYAAYILMVTNWTPNGIRYYLLALPVCWPITNSTGGTRRARVLTVTLLGILGLLTQWWWIRYVLTISPEGMSIP